MIYNFENSKPQINQDVLNCVENYFNIKLPESYRQYLLEVNGGMGKRNIFLFPNTCNNGSSISHWYGIRSDPHFSLLQEMYDRGVRYPEHFISICEDVFGNKLLLSLKGPDYGKIYFWDHEQETDTPDYSNLTLIADSFDEFINGLKSEEEIEA